MWDPGLILLQSPISNMAKQRQMMNKLNATKGRNQLQRTSKQRDKPRAAIPRSVSEDPDVLRYYLALTEPFHPDAVGARVPDMYAAHTATYTVHATHTVTVNSSGAGTIFMFPNVIASIFAPQGGSSDFQTITWGDNTTTTLARWGINDDALAAKLDNYRIVGCGMRIANMSSMTNAQGKFIAGTYAIDSSWHTKDFQIAGVTMPTNSAATPGNTMADWGVPTAVNGSFASNLLIQYPGAQLKSAMELGEHCIDIVPRPVDPRAFSFRTCNAQLNGWQTAGAAAGGAVVTGGAEFLDLCGFEAAFVTLQGAVPSTSTFDVEIIYHIEGRPYLAGVATTTAQSTIIAPSTSSASPVNPLGFFEAVGRAVHQPAVKEVIEVGAGLIHPTLAKFVNAVL